MFVQPAPDLPEAKDWNQKAKHVLAVKGYTSVTKKHAGICTHLLSVLGGLEQRHGHCGLQNAFVTHVCVVVATIDAQKAVELALLQDTLELSLSTDATSF